MGNSLTEELARLAIEKKKRREEAMASMFEMPELPGDVRRLYGEQARLLRQQRGFAEESWARYKKLFRPYVYEAAAAARAGRIPEYEITFAKQNLQESYEKAKERMGRALSRFGLDISDPRFQETWQKLALFRRAAEAGVGQGIRRSVREGNIQRLAGLVGTGEPAAQIGARALASAEQAYAGAAGMLENAYARALQLTIANLQNIISAADLAADLEYRREQQKLKQQSAMSSGIGKFIGTGATILPFLL